MVHAKRRFRPGIAFWSYPCETIWCYPILYLGLLLLEAVSLIQGVRWAFIIGLWDFYGVSGLDHSPCCPLSLYWALNYFVKCSF
ncbi:hypothetical protein PRUPE_3G118200 [Prunus persica]|uniref:Uncharacterized protein n=1 Tax=Prunus persica TaxID=3760 RepID=A0A251PYS8_PRUPE|nr:hypothetical protein PRUPE_3G118200 [Prunus persica]